MILNKRQFLASSMPTGSNARTFAPMSCKAIIKGIEGASRMSSVLGLKVGPRTATVLPRNTPAKLTDTLRAMARSQDLRTLIKTAHDRDLPMRILEAVETVNDTTWIKVAFACSIAVG